MSLFSFTRDYPVPSVYSHLGEQQALSSFLRVMVPL
jgi:hypothetical protein